MEVMVNFQECNLTQWLGRSQFLRDQGMKRDRGLGSTSRIYFRLFGNQEEGGSWETSLEASELRKDFIRIRGLNLILE